MAITISIASGKGGVGKTFFSSTLALYLALLKNRVLLIDTDLGMGNVSVMLQLESRVSLLDVLKYDLDIREAIILNEDVPSLEIISGGNAATNLLSLNKEMAKIFFMKLKEIYNIYDFIIFDLGAGANSFNLNVFNASERKILIINPENPSIIDAFSFSKLCYTNFKTTSFKVIVNRCSPKEFKFTAEKLNNLANLINITYNYCGYIPEIREVKDINSIINLFKIIKKYKNELKIITKNVFVDDSKLYKSFSLEKEEGFIQKVFKFFKRA